MQPIAPPVEGRLWISPDPLTPADLSGQVVVVAFWSFGCETSVEVLQRLQFLAETWPSQVEVLAVHSPRFPYEDDEAKVRQAIARHRVMVPVVHDPEYLTWNRYNPPGWPALTVVGRDGRVAGMASGLHGFAVVAEAVHDELDRPQQPSRRLQDTSTDQESSASIDQPNGASAGNKNVQPIARAIPDPTDQDCYDELASLRDESTLWFPSAVAVGPGDRLAVADSGNDRLLIGTLDPDLRTFRPEVELTEIANPNAVAFGGEDLVYVIEREVGAVLQVDLEAGAVDVVADEELEAPTAILVDQDGSLVIADAGLDQLIRIVGCGGSDVMLGPIAGIGDTGCEDGPSDVAELAQPVGLIRTANGIAFCDAASSNIRILTDDGTVRTVTGNQFFDWGLVDGPADQARLQRPGALAMADDGSIFVADTGNDRIRVLQNRRIQTLGLSGLAQPSGLAILESGHLVIADTNNHRLVMADPDGRSAWPIAVYPAAMTSIWDDVAVGDLDID